MKVWRSRVGGADTATAPRRGSRFIGVDVGGTKILGLVTDGISANAVDRELQATPKHDPDELAPAIVGVVETLLARNDDVVGIGVGVPGLVDHAGVLHYGPNVQGVLGLDIAGRLNQTFSLPAVAENDGYLTALTEHRLGAARGHDHAIVVTQGTGIGGGLIVGGQVLRGANGFAGEPGHMLVNRFGHRCACGNTGCWESVSSGAGLANLARDVVEEGQGSAILAAAGGDPAAIRGEHVSAAYDAGDPGAAETMQRFSFWVAQGIGSLIALLDPSIVVLGGGLSTISGGFLDEVASQVGECVVGGPYRPVVPIVSADFGAEAGAVGAGLRARDFVING
ncbi:MAG: ROK family protein [Actinomycetota bacterium]